MTTRKRHKQQNKHTKEAIKIAENKEQTDERTEVIINNACNKSSSSSNSSSSNNSSSNISHSNNNCLQQLEQWHSKHICNMRRQCQTLQWLSNRSCLLATTWCCCCCCTFCYCYSCKCCSCWCCCCTSLAQRQQRSVQQRVTPRRLMATQRAKEKNRKRERDWEKGRVSEIECKVLLACIC